MQRTILAFALAFIQTNLEKIASLNSVSCSNKYPIISALESETIESIIPSIYHKAGDWKYEKEYRLFNISYPDPFDDKKRKMKISDDCFADITLGLTFEETKIKELKKVLRKKKIPLYKIEKVPRMFKLSRKRIY